MEPNINVNYSLRFAEYTGVFYVGFFGPAQGELAIQCQAHSCSLNQAAVIATNQRGLPLLLEAGIALALRGTGYENEAAADMVFKPRSSGGLAAAIEYVCRLVA